MARRFSAAFVAAMFLMAAALMQRSAAQTTHVVGDARGWIIPTGNPAAYANWAANQTFTVGDVLVFNFLSTAHNVAEVSKADYDACTTSNPISLATTSPASITLNVAGEHYYICNFTGHCSSGQRLAINASGAASSPAPQPSSPAPQPSPTPVSAPSPAPVSTPPPSPVSAPSPTPSRSPRTYTVGDTAGWRVLGAAAYRTWASGKTFTVGDILVFNYPNGVHDVAEVTKEAYGSCNTTSPLSRQSNPPTRLTLSTPGEHFYICTVAGHCSGGQQLAINVTSGSAVATPPSSTTTSPPTVNPSPSTPSPTGVNPPPSPGSATSLGVAGLSATILSIFVAYLLY